jgi:hypothetical protein
MPLVLSIMVNHRDYGEHTRFTYTRPSARAHRMWRVSVSSIDCASEVLFGRRAGKERLYGCMILYECMGTDCVRRLQTVYCQYVLCMCVSVRVV